MRCCFSTKEGETRLARAICAGMPVAEAVTPGQTVGEADTIQRWVPELICVSEGGREDSIGLMAFNWLRLVH